MAKSDKPFRLRKKMPDWAKQERRAFAWPTLEFMQKGQKTSHQVEEYLLQFTSSTEERRSEQYANGLTVWRNMVSWILVDLGESKLGAITALKQDLARPGGGLMGLYRVTSHGKALTADHFP